ncbi:MAG TPA: L-threonylcarbamoyladenylate synthase, partial [Bacteroidota bacterium]|nr:L-threonylcarbamoyladenylate synthase [Bacteroidota bacterium]
MDTNVVHLSDNFHEAINSSIKVLKNGGVIIFPTDTVYGIGCLWNFDDAIKNIFEIKHRDYTKPLSAYFSSIEMMDEYVAEIPDIFYEIAKKYLPGALTIILKKKDKISNIATSNLPTIGIRIPNNHFILELVQKLGEPILGTSANISNEGSIKSAKIESQIF